jgi:biopolymer transport protein ExbD
LIIFFLLSSHLAQQETQTELELPTAASGEQAVDDSRPRLTVNVDDDGSVMLGSTPTTTQDMAGRLRLERDKLGEDMEVRVRADRSVPYAAIEPILVACADAGIWNVTFAVVKRVESQGFDRLTPGESRAESQNL